MYSKPLRRWHRADARLQMALYAAYIMRKIRNGK